MNIRPQRREALAFMICIVLFILALLHRSRYLISLLLEDGGSDYIYPTDVPPVDTTLPQLIPKIIHQTYKTTDLPEHWRAAQQAVRDLHPDYEYMFWTDEGGLEFIRANYSAFFPVYISYQYPIQRVDALRYFLLHHYGGIYIDLDLFPYRSFTPLLTFPAIACRTTPTGISNDILFSTPKHPFFTLVLERLGSYNRNLFLPYLTVMYTTGPLFLSAIWMEYGQTKSGGRSALERLHVLAKGPQRGDSYGFFKNIQGGSWHEDDLQLILWTGDHWILVTFLLVVIGAKMLVISWMVFKKCVRQFSRQKGRYQRRID